MAKCNQLTCLPSKGLSKSTNVLRNHRSAGELTPNQAQLSVCLATDPFITSVWQYLSLLLRHQN